MAFWLFPWVQYHSQSVPQHKALLIFAGQFAHMSLQHLSLNLLGLLLLAWGFAPWRTPVRDLMYIGAGLLGVAAGLLFHPEVVWYRGLSGAFHGLFMAYSVHVLICDSRTPVKTMASVLIFGSALKLWLELNQPELISGAHNASEPVLHAAHRWGAMAGVIAGVAGGTLTRR